MARAFDPASLKAALLKEVPVAWSGFWATAGIETPYSFALYHNEDWGYVLATGNTIEGLERTTEIYRRKKPAQYAGDQGLDLLRWSFCDSPFHGRLPELARSEALLLDNPPSGAAHTAYTRAARGACIDALRTLDREGLFGVRRTEIALNVVLGDMSDKVFDSGLKSLNSAATFDRYSNCAAAKRREAALKHLSPATRAEFFLAAIREAAERDLSWVVPTTEGVSRVDAEDHLTKMGLPGVDAIVTELGRVISGESHQSLGTLVFDLPKIKKHITDDHIRRLQTLVKASHARYTRPPPNYTLTENIARVLHKLRPKLFPATDLNEASNTLRNVDRFVP